MKGKKSCKADGGMVGVKDANPAPNMSIEKGVKSDATAKKSGGMVKAMKVEGKAPKMKAGKPMRKSGGRVSCNEAPFTSAAKVTQATDHKTQVGDID